MKSSVLMANVSSSFNSKIPVVVVFLTNDLHITTIPMVIGDIGVA